MVKGKSVNARVTESTLTAEIAESWLIWQCQMVAGVIQGAIFAPSIAESASDWLATWPGNVEGDPMLQVIAQDVIDSSGAIMRSSEHYGSGDASTCNLIGCPLVAGDKLIGVVVLMISSRSESQQHAILQLLQWGSLWIEKLMGQRIAYKQEFGTFTANLISTALGRSSTRETATKIVNLLADNFRCQRVCLGLHDGVSIKLVALSHAARIDPRTQLVRRIEAAMEEASDQSSIIVEPTDTVRGKVITRAHKELLAHDGTGAVCSVPLEGSSGHVGALVFERSADLPFDEEFIANAGSLARLIARSLEIKRREERSFLLKGKDGLMDLMTALVGPSYLKLKIFAMFALILLAISIVFSGEYRVTAPASIEGEVRYMLVAPHEGYIEQASARAGDVVKKGQLVAQLYDRGLKLELQKWQGELNKLQNVYQEALALRDRTKLAMTMAKLDQAKAELELVQGQLDRSTLYAPIDGVIVRGDYSQSVGAPIETGQILFEVAPLDSYEVVLKVDEFDMAGMQPGKSGRLIIAALPDSTFALSITKVVPIAVPAEGRTYFRVEATLDEPTELLRPGMEGIAKVDMGERRLFWIWTHSIVDRLRLWFWAIG